jgi:hypothetical protein
MYRDRGNQHGFCGEASRAPAKIAACASAVLGALALAPGAAHAAVYSDTGWVQLQASASDFASTTIAGYDFGVGYSAHLGIEGYNWDVAPNTVSVSCISYVVDGIITLTIPITQCPTLPGTKLSQTVVSTSTTFNGLPATRKTTTIVWDVPDAGALARADGFFAVPATLFSEDFDALKLTGTAVGNTSGIDTVSAQVFVLGSQIASGFSTLPFNRRLVHKCATLFDVDASFSVVGIPITVGASSDGCLDVDANVSFVDRTLSGTLTPGANVDATFSAGIGLDIVIASAQAGVSGNITVVDARLPLTFSAAIGDTALTLSESGRLTMTGLDGEVDLFAEGCLLGGCVDGSLTIFDWTGLTFVNATLFSLSQTLTF